MVFERRTERREKRAEEIEGTPEVEDISVFPMGIADDRRTRLDRQRDAVGRRAPKTPVRDRRRAWRRSPLVILMTLVTLLAAGPLMKLIGEKIEAAITRILGVILAALAAQFIVDGLKQSFPSALG